MKTDHRRCNYCGALKHTTEYDKDSKICIKCEPKYKIYQDKKEDGFLNCAKPLTNKEIKLQKKWIRENKKKAKEQMHISKGKI